MAQRSALFVVIFISIFVVLASIMSLWLGSSICKQNTQPQGRQIVCDIHTLQCSIVPYVPSPSTNGAEILDSYFSLVTGGLFNKCDFPQQVVIIATALNTIILLFITLSIIFWAKGTT